MSPDRLVYMANQIGKFFEVQRADEVVPGIANHIKKFWDPRMRKAIFAYLDEGGDGLDPPVREALEQLKAEASGRRGTHAGNELPGNLTVPATHRPTRRGLPRWLAVLLALVLELFRPWPGRRTRSRSYSPRRASKTRSMRSMARGETRAAGEW